MQLNSYFSSDKKKKKTIINRRIKEIEKISEIGTIIEQIINNFS